MVTIRQLMESNREAIPVTIGPEATVFEALKLMADKNVGAVIVVGRGDQMEGIFTERDYARKIILMGRSSLDTRLEEIMTHEMVSVHPEQTLEEGLELMAKHYIRHLPIMEKGRLVGMISMRDIMVALLQTKDETIERLESYILGKEYQR